MKSGIGRPLVFAAVLVGAILEIILARGNTAVAWCGVLALLACGWTIPLLPWRDAAVLAGVLRPARSPFRRTASAAPHHTGTLARPRPAPRPASASPMPVHSPDGAVPGDVAAGGAVAVADPATDAAFPDPSRLGPRGAAAHQFPGSPSSGAPGTAAHPLLDPPRSGAPAHSFPDPAGSGAPGATALSFPDPPRFGARGAAAHPFPWLLPRYPAPSAVQADEALVGGLQVRAASVIGPSHRCQEPAHPRQDAYRLGRDPDGRFLVIAVADGLSSGKRSDLGADAATRSAVEALLEQVRRDPDVTRLDAPAVFLAAAGAIRDAAGDLTPDDLNAVLVTAVVDSRPDARGNHPMWIGWIGDSSVWTLIGGVWAAVAGDLKTAPAGTASNAVRAWLPEHPDAACQLLIGVPPGAAVAVVTDGVGDALTGIPEAAAYLAERWARPPALGALLNDVNFDARQHLDDRTAAVLWTPAGDRVG